MRRCGLWLVLAVTALTGASFASALPTAPWVVTTRIDAVDGEGPLSLREAVLAAGEAGGEQVILLPPGTYTLNRDGVNEDEGLVGDLDVRQGSVTIYGAGADRTRVVWERDRRINRLFDVHSGASLTLVGLTLAKGGWENDGGSAVRNRGSLRLDRCRLTGNQNAWLGALVNLGSLLADGCEFVENTNRDAGVLYNHSTSAVILRNCLFARNAGAEGGAIFNDVNSRMLIDGCCFTRNSAGRTGGAIHNKHTALDIVNTTFYQNHAGFRQGGALYNYGFQPVHVSFSTVAGNHADQGAGIFQEPQADLQLNSCVVAGNLTSWGALSDVEGTVASLGHNVITGVREAAGLVESDLLGVDPRLTPLGDFGGPTPVCALQSGSVAIDRGNGAGAPATDQRGALRPGISGGAVDAGAFEAGSGPVLSTPLGVSMFRAGGAPAPVGETVTLLAPDAAALSGGTFSATVVEAAEGDRLTVLSQGLVTAAGSEVRYTGELVGTLSGRGTPGDPLVVMFAGPAVTVEAVAAVARSLGFDTSSESPLGPRTVRIQLVDGLGRGTTPAEPLVTVAPPDPVPVDNRAPTATPDRYEVVAGTPFYSGAPGLLANDVDPEGDPLRALLVDPPPLQDYGLFQLNQDGSFVYRPDLDDPEIVRFTYRPADPWTAGEPVTVELVVRRAPPPTTPNAAVRVQATAQQPGYGNIATFSVRVTSDRLGRVRGTVRRAYDDGSVSRSTRLQALTVEGKHARIYGLWRYRRSSREYRFVLDVDDLADPGVGQDRLRMETEESYSVFGPNPIQSGEARVWRTR